MSQPLLMVICAWGNTDWKITIQYCILSESLNFAKHGYASIEYQSVQVEMSLDPAMGEPVTGQRPIPQRKMWKLKGK